MAKDKKTKSGNSKVLGLVKSLQSSMDLLYKNTYITQPSNSRDLTTIKNNLDDSIDNIVANNINSIGSSSISQLYNRINVKNSVEGSNSIGDEIENLFNGRATADGLLSSFTENKYLKEYDEEIDLICKYMPKLVDALETKKDSVLAADNYSKDFLNVLNESNVNKEVSFNDRITTIKKTYKLQEFLEECYDNTAYYGEQFIYIVPYKKAFSRMVNNGRVKDTKAPQLECTIESNENIITESFAFGIDNVADSGKSTVTHNMKVQLNLTGVVESVVNSHRSKTIIMEKTNNFDKTIDSNLEFEGIGDGFIDTKKVKEKKVSIDVPGVIIKKLKRENVIPIYIDDTCLGYYYIECEFEDIFTSKLMDMTAPLKNGKLVMQNETEKKDLLLRQMSSKLSQFIDTNFIKANQDLKKEIYMILKYNQDNNMSEPTSMNITFIPVEDMVHMYFNKDEKTHRGISDLDNALLPAKLFISLYVTNTMGIITRGHDKRVYYVKQTVDSNISKTLLNTINQIKKSNFGARELTSMKNMLNIQGRFNDFVIPVGSTGDSPINFEVMQGQDIDPKTELLEMLEEMSISSTDVPYEFIQSSKMVDFAVRLTMSNGKFLRKIFKRQAQSEIIFSDVITRIYNAEYDEKDQLEVMLPPPAFLNITNANQMLNSVNEYVEQLVQMEMGEEEDDRIKMIYAKKLKHRYLSAYIDMKAIQTCKDQTLIEAKQKYGDEE